jgi:hypothetical protein
MRPLESKIVRSSRGGGKWEEDDDYAGGIITSDGDVRVINCKDNIQWIVQHRKGEVWRSRSFCRTRAALIRCANGLSPHALAALWTLPEVHP